MYRQQSLSLQTKIRCIYALNVDEILYGNIYEMTICEKSLENKRKRITECLVLGLNPNIYLKRQIIRGKLSLKNDKPSRSCIHKVIIRKYDCK